MEPLLRAIAIVIEISILTAIIGCMLAGAELTLFDLGLGSKYRKMLAVALLVAGSIAVVFFIAHLTSFYPGN